MNEFHQKFFDLAGRAQRVLLSTHRDPDGYAIASLLAAYFLLIQKFPDKVIKMMVSSPINDRFKAFANFDKIESVADISDHLDEFDLLVFVDANFSGRFTDKVDHLNEHEKGKVFYSISTVENNGGKFVCIHEKRENRNSKSRY